MRVVGSRVLIASSLLLSLACNSGLTPEEERVEDGRRIFFQETFQGNGRTCRTCHRPEDNFRITPEFIATLPPDDPLFVAEANSELSQNFEKPNLMRQFGLILMNPDGFHDLDTQFVMRTVQSLRSLRTSIRGVEFDGFENDIDFQPVQTGWAGDGAPGDGALRSFAIGSVRQHMTKSLDRVPGIDFRLPTNGRTGCSGSLHADHRKTGGTRTAFGIEKRAGESGSGSLPGPGP